MSSIAPSLAAPEDGPYTEACRPQPVGPLWMAGGVCLMFFATAGLATFRRSMGATPDYSEHAIIYSSQIIGAWLLLAATLATVYHRRSFLRESLLKEGRPCGTEFARGLAVFAVFIVIAGVVAGVLQLASRKLAFFDAGSHLLQSTDHRLNVSHSSAVKLLPMSGVDLLVWTGVSLSAAFCEELIFRGYLLRQCIAGLRKLALSERASVILAVALTAALFGALHIYEGMRTALTIAFLGAAYAIAALRFGNLRAVIIAHFLQDFSVGVFSCARHFFVPR